MSCLGHWAWSPQPTSVSTELPSGHGESAYGEPSCRVVSKPASHWAGYYRRSPI